MISTQKKAAVVTEMDEQIGKRIKLIREFNLDSQTFLAERLGIKAQQISKYEFAINRISACRLYEIAKIYQVPIMFFLEPHDQHVARFAEIRRRSN